MAFDGITVASLTDEFNRKLKDGRINKIAQTENDELMITWKAGKSQYKMLLSANASLPLIYFTSSNKQSPMTAPNFCMLLRKHIGNGKLLSVTQPGLERIIDFEIQHFNELGDLCVKHLIVELMGKHSNIIFTDNAGMILDSIKHINSLMSSVRQVLPGRKYFIPDTMEKSDPLTVTKEDFYNLVFSKPLPLSKAIYSSLTGISPTIAENICFENKLDSSQGANTFADGDKNLVWMSFYQMRNKILNHDFYPVIYEKNGKPEAFSALPLKTYSDCDEIPYDSISELLESYYSKKDSYTRMRQKSVDLRKIVSNALERETKKYNLQLRQMKDTEKKDKYKVYGEVLSAFGYSIEPGAKQYIGEDFYSHKEITIPLDPTLTPIENAKKYFDKYTKLKRTQDALSSIIIETEQSIKYLETIMVSIEMADSEDDLKAISQELAQTGYIKKKRTGAKKEKIKSKPLHFISSDGYHMYVGKNNLQNEEITFKLANGGDWWFHSKTFPGSHVIVKGDSQELPDSTFEEAARLAAHYSKGAGQDKVDIDYTKRKNLRKVPGAMPGFVIYHEYYSMSISPDISGIEEL